MLLHWTRTSTRAAIRRSPAFTNRGLIMSYALTGGFAGDESPALWRRQRALLLLPERSAIARAAAPPPALVGIQAVAGPVPARRSLGTLAVAAVAAHVALAAYLVQDRVLAPPEPKPRTVLELTRPKPPEPKPEPVVEPPKPLPQTVKPVATPRPPPVLPAPAPTPVEAVAPEAPVAYVEPTPPAPPVVAEPVKETAAVGYAGYLDNPAPNYPATAQRMGWEGTVLLKVRVLADGRPASVELQQSSGRKLLDDAALSTVRRWLFTPAKRGEVAVEGWATVPIDFKLS